MISISILLSRGIVIVKNDNDGHQENLLMAVWRTY
jgi:hypothetical protein